MRLIGVRLLSTLVILSLPTAAQVHVPGDYSTLQEAVDGVLSGQVIVVHGGSHDAIVIDKSITIIGSPEATIDSSDTFRGPFGFDQAPAISLNGPGHGFVTLERVRTTGITSLQAHEAGEGIAGGGFDELTLIDCVILPSFNDPSFLDGDYAGASGIAVSTTRLTLVRSVVLGGGNVYWFTDWDGYDAGPAINAPGATVVLRQCQIVGGNAVGSGFPPVFVGCPPTCDDIVGGGGGAGVVAERVYATNSTIQGGAGATFYCDQPSLGMVICTKPPAPSIVARVSSLQGGLH